MSPLRMRMIEDMTLAGLSPGTQATYIDAVRKPAAYYRRSPDQLSEEDVRAHILNLRERGAAHLQGELLRHPVSVSIHGQPRLGAVRKKRSVCRAASVMEDPQEFALAVSHARRKNRIERSHHL